VIASIEKPGTPAELVHFGVKGMKWGVRKKIESTSGAKKFKEVRRARKEKRIKRAEADVVRAQAAIDQITSKGRSINPYTRHVRANQVKELSNYRDRRAQDAKDIRAGKLTKRQKQVLVGAGAAAVVLAAYGSYRFVETGTARQMLIRTPLKKNDLLSRKMSPDAILKEVVAPINPGYGEIGTKVNCRRCTFAYEMRRRGNDVKATHAVRGLGQNVPGMMNATDPNAKFKTDRYSSAANMYKEQFAKLRAKESGVTLKPGPFEQAMESRGFGKRVFTSDVGAKFHQLTSDEKTSRVFDTLEIFPEGARGEISSQWVGGGRHSQAWEIIGGRAHIFDTQTGESYDAAKFLKEMAPRLNDAGYTRLDNIPLNENFLRRWVTNAD
jgi:hypothetical protein